MRVEVLVVGAGPAGSAAAIHLARRGREVLLVDRCRFPRRKPCGEYYNPEAVRLLGALGVLPAMRGAGAGSIGALAVGASGGCSLTAPFSRVAGGVEALSLGREVLDTLLVDAAREAGVRVWEGVEVLEPLLDAGRVVGARCREQQTPRTPVSCRHPASPGSVERSERAGSQHPPGAPETEVRAEIVLAADGLRSRFARRLGLAVGDGGRRKFGVTARCTPVPGAAGRIMMQPGPGGSCGLVARRDEANLGMVVDGARLRELGGNPARFFAAALAEFPALADAVAGPVHDVLTVGPLTWITRHQVSAGCLLLGDAAGFYDPFTGQGVTFALLTAALAAEVADAALADVDVSASRLTEYSRRRQQLLGTRVLVQKGVQVVMERPWLREQVLERLSRRPAAASLLLGVIADVLPPARLLHPDFARRLLL